MVTKLLKCFKHAKVYGSVFCVFITFSFIVGYREQWVFILQHITEVSERIQNAKFHHYSHELDVLIASFSTTYSESCSQAKDNTFMKVRHN